MKIQSTARRIDASRERPLADLAARRDTNAAVEIDLVASTDIQGNEVLTLQPGLKVMPITGGGEKSPIFRFQDGIISASTGVLNFTDLGLEKYAQSVHESAEAPLDVLLTIVASGKALSSFQQHGFTDWNTIIDIAGTGTSAFASIGHFIPQLEPYSDGAKLVRLVLQTGKGLHEAVLAAREI